MPDYTDVIVAYPAMSSYYLHIFKELGMSIAVLNERDYGTTQLINRLQHAKLVIFTGGEDISPGIYGQNPVYTYGINRSRDEREISVFRNTTGYSHAKILGVCRGHQLVAALSGFQLVQDITLEKNVTHSHAHTLENVGKKSFVRFFEHEQVNSMHHQAVQEWSGSARGFRITSSHKNVVESIESKNIAGVQFHPEVMASGKYNAKSPVWKFWTAIAEWANTVEPEEKTSTNNSYTINPSSFAHEPDYTGQSEEEIEQILEHYENQNVDEEEE